MEREQIIKALECFHQRILNTDLAKKITENEMMAVIDAIALIKEQTEENERLIEAGFDTVDYAIDKIREAKADTVRKMKERLKQEAGYFGRAVAVEVIDQIAKEMLGENENGQRENN